MRWLAAPASTCLLGCSALACAGAVSSGDANEVPGAEAPWPQLDVHETGPGWRIVDGVYEALQTGLRISGGEGWTPFVGGELALLVEDIQVGLRHEQLDITIALLRDPYSTPGAVIPADMLEFMSGKPLGRSATVQFVGAELKLHAGADRLYTHLFGGHWIDDVFIYVTVRYPTTAEYAAIEAAIGEALGRIELLDARELGYHRSWIDKKWREDVVIANRDRTLYLLHVRGRGSELFEQTLASLEWVDCFKARRRVRAECTEAPSRRGKLGRSARLWSHKMLDILQAFCVACPSRIKPALSGG